MSPADVLLRKISPTYSQRLLHIQNFIKSKCEFGFGYTSQGILHAERVVENLENLITSDILDKLDDLEIFCLLASAYLHDIGLLIPGKGGKRRDHALRSAEIIRSEYMHLGLDTTEAFLIGIICRAHPSQVDLSSVPPVVPVGRRKPRLRLLAALLRLADALDIDYRRLPFESETRTGDYWKIHQAIIGWSFDSGTNTIIVSLRAFPKDVPRKYIDVLINELKKVLESTSKTLMENGFPSRNVTCQILKYPKR